MIKAKNIRLKYPGGERLFNDLSFTCDEGEKILLLGPSGCGKSTLLQVLSGLIPEAIDVPMIAEELQLPESWGYVFQDPDTQFCMPYVDEELAFVLENLAVPRENMDEKITELIQTVGLHLQSPHTKINELSGGMKQRLAIASVLAMEPDVLFLDEPTAMLDPQGTKELWETMKKIGQDKTVIIVEHKLDYLLDFANRVVVFQEDGSILADGKTDVIFHDYKEKLKEFGIWYPGVWKEFAENNSKPTVKPFQKDVLVSMDQLLGFRGKEEKIKVEQANIHKGEWITIVGENGAGKSTLLESIMGLLKTQGDCMIHSNNPNPQGGLAFVFQNPEFQFVTNSVSEEIAYTLKINKIAEDETKAIVEQFLREFHLKHVENNHPYSLSTGQKRRLSVASSVVHHPQVLLLDEPTFGQDSKNTFSMLKWLQELKEQGVSIVMVTHDEHIVDHFADTVWVVENGVLSTQLRKEEYVKKQERREQHAMVVGS
ncbi:ABC transporter ATP-binding protein [Bacillus alkalisoli]|uniref:ABC transporter ATP-binding protein n=1 Tax=Bacillus alkalisoli TaxID=2011008 RepID=UPI000C2393CD|nr:ATP-binding cassette domain-containing protein [Bacillus alkalisoli]